MQINDFLHAGGYAGQHRDAVIHDIACVTASNVEGVDTTSIPGEEGCRVTVESDRGDVCLYILAVLEPGADEKRVKQEIHQRVQAALWNLLEVQAVSIQIELVYRDGVPPALAKENRTTIPFS